MSEQPQYLVKQAESLRRECAARLEYGKRRGEPKKAWLDAQQVDHVLDFLLIEREELIEAIEKLMGSSAPSDQSEFARYGESIRQARKALAKARGE
ncbi:hypothetical protein [Modicisalibacter coralii]|uniref:hypothetical protein n=1 Tax=Modicisalibacter coralii TaxID=2304602 RepID=UPI00100B4137|nr:hypothetical protein [Halomonas coralii]